MPPFISRALGKTGLRVSPLGIGGGGKISSRDLLYAFDRGINYFFYSSDLHHAFYRRSAGAIRELCGAGSRVRDQVVLATVSYVNDPEKLVGVLVDQLAELRVDHVDVFHWGWVTERAACAGLFDAAHALKEESDGTRWVRDAAGRRDRMEAASEGLVRRGLARFVGASFHDRRLAADWLPSLDVVMLRYNMAHPGAEEEIFPRLSGDRGKDPGVVVFNAAHGRNGMLHQRPPGYPARMYVPRPPDCYRWVLSHPAVDVVLTGVGTRGEIVAALAAVERGSMSEAERAALCKYGALHAGRLRVREARARTADTGLEPASSREAALSGEASEFEPDRG